VAIDRLPSGSFRGWLMIDGRRCTATLPTEADARIWEIETRAAVALRCRSASVTFAAHAANELAGFIEDAPDRARFEAALEDRLLPVLGEVRLLEVLDADRDELYRYRATHVLTQDAQDRWFSPGVVDVRDGRITFVGDPNDVPALDDIVMSQLEGVLLPGFVDAHAHSPMVLLRGAGEGLPVDRWLTEVMWPREIRLTPDDVRVGMTLGAAQLVTGGITTSSEMYFHPEAMAEGGREVGLRSLIAPPLLVADGLAALGTWEHQLERMVAFARDHEADPLVEGVIGPHAAYSVPEEPLREAGRLAAAEGLLLHIHVAEQQHEADAIRDRTGLSVPRYLERLGVLEARVLAAHGVWLDDDDIGVLADHGVGVAHCPSSNGKHASGMAPVVPLRQAGVSVAIATDGPASHDRLDLFEEMRTAIRLARLRGRDANALGVRDALRMVTREAADAIGRNDLGAIEVGRRADLVHLDLDPIALSPIVEVEDLLTHLVWSGSPALVRDVWIEGRPVVRDGRVITVDVEAVAAEVTVRARRLAVGA
jgi:5-methylthioadenosine/S-adenosylhomocysteine deaminase